MIHEIATIDVKPGSGKAFEQAVRNARPHFEEAKGFRSVALNRSVEIADRYHLVVGWDTVENHMVDFRNSPGFVRWRELASPYFAGPPTVEHVAEVSLD